MRAADDGPLDEVRLHPREGGEEEQGDRERPVERVLNKVVLRLVVVWKLGEPRKASVYAVDNCTCLYVTRDTFMRILGPLKSVLERNVGKYEKYADAMTQAGDEGPAGSPVGAAPGLRRGDASAGSREGVQGLQGADRRRNR